MEISYLVLKRHTLQSSDSALSVPDEERDAKVAWRTQAYKVKTRNILLHNKYKL